MLNAILTICIVMWCCLSVFAFLMGGDQLDRRDEGKSDWWRWALLGIVTIPGSLLFLVVALFAAIIYRITGSKV